MREKCLKIFIFVLVIVIHKSFISIYAQENLFTSFSKEEKRLSEVVRIHDASLMSLSDGRKIQLIGLKPLPAPRQKKTERDQHGFIIDRFDPLTSLEEQAFLFVQNLIEKKEIIIEFDKQYRNAEGYIAAYVFLPDGTFVNKEILRQGYADLRLSPPNTRYSNKLRKAYQEARYEKRGLHGK